MKRFITTIFYLSFFLQTFAQSFNFVQHTLYEPGLIIPQTIHTVDLDNDGYKDHILDSYIMGSANQHKIVWFKNDGSQNYSQIDLIYTDGPLGYFDVLDFDLDGDLDILKISDNNLVYYENNGNQSFTASILASVSGEIKHFHVEDIDSDGDNDIVLDNEDEEELYWFENDGINSLTSHLITQSFKKYSSFEIIDLDADGDFDIVGVERINLNDLRVSWYENDGAQNFSVDYGPMTSIAIANVQLNRIMNVVDVDNDGDLDIVAGIGGSYGLCIFKNDGSEVFTIDLLRGFVGATTSSHTIKSLDIDSDGDIDIVQVSHAFSSIFINDGSGGFIEQSIASSFDRGTAFGLADNDNDGDIDINIVYNREDDVLWLENDGNLQFTKHTIYDAPLSGAIEMLPIDLDQDLDIDIITVGQQAKNLIWFENDGNENFNHTYISDTIGEVNSVSAVDLDEDGDIDILSTSSNPPKMLWFENDGSQNFTEHFVYSNWFNIGSSLKGADIDNDGDIDLISVGTSKLIVFSNDGIENFTEQVVLDSNININDVLPFDIDTDGDIDLFLSVSDINKIHWLENDGIGNFVLHEFATSSNGQAEMYIEDLDNDGDYDLAAASEINTGYWFKNDGNQNFTEMLPVIYCGGSIHGNDMDEDGNIDLVTNLGLFISDDNQNFTWNNMNNNIPASGDSYSVDLDNDGDFDVLLLTASNNQRLFWNENLLYSNYIKISVISFIDENGNGIYDNNDYFFQNSAFEMSPQATFIMSTEDTTTILLNDTGLYTLDIQLDTALWLATSPTSVQVDVISEDFYDTVYFGVQPKLDVALSSDITGMWPRCFDENNYSINMVNYGSTIDSGYFEFTIDDSSSFISSVPSPDSINGKTLYYEFSNLQTTHSKEVDLKVLMPNTIMGIEHDYLLHVDTGQWITVDSLSYLDTVRCSYDPNDKQVFPNFGDSGYILNHQELEYLIRFQNTGNDTAFVVELTDVLDINLDISTFRLISTSHNLTFVGIDSNRVLSFLFEDINLIDTFTNETESHGFVKYGIELKENIPFNTNITNTASIYFDHNLPIITNTTLNTTYDCNTLGSSIQLELEYPEIIAHIDEVYLESAYWLFNGDTIHSGTDGFTFTPTVLGDVEISVHFENHLCTFDTVYSIFVGGIGMVENHEESQLTVFPNPTTGMCHVDLGVEMSEFKIRLSTISGKFLKENVYHSTRMIELALPEEKGIYLLEILMDNHKSEFVKVVKQ